MRGLWSPRTSEVVVFLARRRFSEVLVARRRAELGGFWHGISGSAERGETPTETAVREVLEETGLDVAAAVRDAAAVRYRYRRPRRRLRTSVRCFLVLVADDAEPTLNWEHDAMAWHGRDEAVELLEWRSTRDALTKLLATAPPLA